MDSNKYKPLLLSTQEQIVTYWPLVEPMLARAPIVTEFSPSDIRSAATAGQMFVFIFVANEINGPDIGLVLVLAPTMYPQLPAMTIITATGSGLKNIAAEYWEYLKGWMYMNGVRAIDAYVPERMESFITTLGFTKEATHVRYRL